MQTERGQLLGQVRDIVGETTYITLQTKAGLRQETVHLIDLNLLLKHGVLELEAKLVIEIIERFNLDHNPSSKPQTATYPPTFPSGYGYPLLHQPNTNHPLHQNINLNTNPTSLSPGALNSNPNPSLYPSPYSAPPGQNYPSSSHPSYYSYPSSSPSTSSSHTPAGSSSIPFIHAGSVGGFNYPQKRDPFIEQQEQQRERERKEREEEEEKKRKENEKRKKQEDQMEEIRKQQQQLYEEQRRRHAAEQEKLKIQQQQQRMAQQQPIPTPKPTSSTSSHSNPLRTSSNSNHSSNSSSSSTYSPTSSSSSSYNSSPSSSFPSSPTSSSSYSYPSTGNNNNTNNNTVTGGAVTGEEKAQQQLLAFAEKINRTGVEANGFANTIQEVMNRRNVTQEELKAWVKQSEAMCEHLLKLTMQLDEVAGSDAIRKRRKAEIHRIQAIQETLDGIKSYLSSVLRSRYSK
eukprot:TRINITY_DN1029_c4_g1_i2.p1 TRINITY_DN1029_c4_g1~~TRINITY_DN1029_c4_g1_i2.p1  ORF type:complete len:459 (-),score=127.54 TRINITY_DN1029_c4_g1_i2:4-1380(-)